MLKDKTVLVTGATGAIGCRLVEKLVLEQGAKVRCLVRNYNRCARIARFPVETVLAQLDDKEGLDAAIAGCDVVFHCAYEWVAQKANITAAGLIADACQRHGARLVHVSTMAVYFPLPDGPVDEGARSEPNGKLYTDTKIAIEALVLDRVKNHRLEAAIVQPAIVYGPFGAIWTDVPVKNLLAGEVVLPEDAVGLCNAVYIDDVADAMILAAERKEAVGERFLVSGPRPVTWHAFYAAFEEAIGAKSVTLLPVAEIRRQNKNLVANLKLILNEPKRLAQWPPLRKLLLFVYGKLGSGIRQKALKLYHFRRKGAPREVFLPDEEQLALFSSRAEIRIDKARRLLGYEPAFDFDEGMRLTRAYVQWAYPQAAGE